jgi:hypothetical protein
MNGGRSLARKGVGLVVVLALLAVLVLEGRRSAARDRDREDATTNQTAPIVVVKTRPDGTIECSDLTSAPSDEGTLVYYWTGPRLRTAVCKPAPAGGVVGLGGV